VEKLDREMLRILAQPVTRELLTKAGFQAVTPSTPPAFQKILQAEIARWVPIVKAAGAKAN